MFLLCVSAAVAAQFHVSKYPTIKMFRNGQLIKREYRGQRSVEAITQFVREQVKDPLTRVESLDDLDNLDVSIFFIRLNALYMFWQLAASDWNFFLYFGILIVQIVLRPVGLLRCERNRGFDPQENTCPNEAESVSSPGEPRL